jgi:hypothetical protein
MIWLDLAGAAAVGAGAQGRASHPVPPSNVPLRYASGTSPGEKRTPGHTVQRHWDGMRGAGRWAAVADRDACLKE